MTPADMTSDVLTSRYPELMGVGVGNFHRRVNSQYGGMGRIFSKERLVECAKLALNDAVWEVLRPEGSAEKNAELMDGAHRVCEQLEDYLDWRFERENLVTKSQLMLLLALAYACENTVSMKSRQGALFVKDALVETGSVSPHYEMYRPFLMREDGTDFLLPSIDDNGDPNRDSIGLRFILMYGKMLGYQWDYSSIFAEAVHVPYIALRDTLLDNQADLADIDTNDIHEFVDDYMDGNMKAVNKSRGIDWVRILEDMVYSESSEYTKLPNEWVMSILGERLR